MALEKDRSVSMLLDLRETDVLGGSEDLRVVLDDYTVMDNGYTGTIEICSVCLEYGCCVDDVIDIPLTRCPHSVYERRGLLVDRSGLAVDIGLVPEAVENLDLVLALHVHTAVSTRLALEILRHRGYAPLDVQLVTSE